MKGQNWSPQHELRQYKTLSEEAYRDAERHAYSVAERVEELDPIPLIFDERKKFVTPHGHEIKGAVVLSMHDLPGKTSLVDSPDKCYVWEVPQRTDLREEKTSHRPDSPSFNSVLEENDKFERQLTIYSN